MVWRRRTERGLLLRVSGDLAVVYIGLDMIDNGAEIKLSWVGHTGTFDSSKRASGRCIDRYFSFNDSFS